LNKISSIFLWTLTYKGLKDSNLVQNKYTSQIESILSEDKDLEDQLLNSIQTEIVRNLFQKSSTDVKKEILSATRNFLLLSLKKMKIQLPFNEEILKDAQVVFLKEFDKEKWLRLQSRFTNILSTDKMRACFCNELDSLEYRFEEIQSEIKAKKKSPLESWANYEEEYPNICILAKAILTLPHSTVSVERIFSNIKDIKTIKRNRLTVENLEACVLCYQNIGKKSFIFADNLVEDICLLNETNPFSQGIESGKEKAQNPTESINSEGDIETLILGLGMSNISILKKIQ